MANEYSDYYKGRVLKGIVGHGAGKRKIYAFGVTSKGKTPSAPTSATCDTAATASVLGAKIGGNTLAGSIVFGAWAETDGIGAGVPIKVSNTEASATLTIPAGTIVHYVGITTDEPTPTLLAYIKLSNPDTQYYYEEQGTLTVPAHGYTIKHG